MNRASPVLAALLWLGAAAPASAVQQIELALGSLAGPGWQAVDVRLVLDMGGDRPAGALQVRQLGLPAPVGAVGPLKVECGALDLGPERIACRRGRLHGRGPGGAPLELTATAEYQPASGRLALRLRAPDLGFASADGLREAEGVSLALALEGQRRAHEWQFRAMLDVDRGALYWDPVYLDFEAQPLAVELAGGWRQRRLRLDSFTVSQAGVASLAGAAEIDTGADVPLRRLQFKDLALELPAAWETWGQPWLLGTLAGDLQIAGRLTGSLSYRRGRGIESLVLRPQALGVSDEAGRFSITGLEGEVNWDRTAQRSSRLAWQAGRFYRVDVGGARLSIDSRGRRLRLAEPAEIPVLDGQLAIEAWSFDVPEGGEGPRWTFDGILTPISLTRLTKALDWPPLAGRLSGVIPDVHYAERRLEVGGVLLVRAFDGDITVRDLVLQDPLGLVPRLYADVRIRNLDLETLTRTFSFGKIEGRLNGRIDGLVLEDWKPVAFDARLETPPGDRSRHRISQKAVDNLTSIGGGVGGALSRTFLGMFEEFPYDRLGLACRLENGVCRMSGVEPRPEGGYYIVKGRLLPRLDIVGFADEVDWEALVERIQAAVETRGVTVDLRGKIQETRGKRNPVGDTGDE